MFRRLVPKVNTAVFTKKCGDSLGKGCEHMITLRYSDGSLTMHNGRLAYKYVCSECSGLIHLPRNIVEDNG